eukprot:1160632-Pelagomonas_calceolata.AAC.4
MTNWGKRLLTLSPGSRKGHGEPTEAPHQDSPQQGLHLSHVLDVPYLGCLNAAGLCALQMLPLRRGTAQS